MERKRIDPKKYLLVFILTAIIFIAGLVVGFFLSDQKLSDVQRLQDTLRTETLDIEIQYALLEQEPCQFVNTTPLSDALYDIAVKLDYMEGQLGKNDANVLRLKRYYSLLEIRQWLFERKVQESCQVDRRLVLYFYSNEPGDCSDCEEQGFILSYLRKKYGDRLAVFSFDSTLDSRSIIGLKRRYGITRTPSLVVGDELYEGYKSTAELEQLLFADPDQEILDAMNR